MDHSDKNILPAPPSLEQHQEQQTCKQLKDLWKFFWRFKYEILGLLNGMIGSLLIFLPYLTYVSGWLTMFLGMIIGGFFNWLSSYFYVIHQHDDYSIGKSFQEHFTCTKYNIFYNFYNITVIISIFLVIIQYLKIMIAILNYLLNIAKDDGKGSMKIEILIFFVSFVVISIMIYKKRNIKFMALTFIATIIYCIFLIVQAIRNSQDINEVTLFQVDYLSDMAIAFNQGFMIQKFCFQFLKRSEAFEKKSRLQSLERVENKQFASEERMMQVQPNRNQSNQNHNEHRQFNRHDYNAIILFTYIAGFIFYSILGFAGSFMIHGKQIILGVQPNLQKTILHYYAFNSPQGIIIGVLVIAHFVVTYPEYLLIMIDLMNRVGRNQEDLQFSAQNIQSTSKKTGPLILIKDFVLIILIVMVNTVINHYLIGVLTPFFLSINGSIITYILLFFIPLIQHFSEFNQSPTIYQLYPPANHNCEVSQPSQPRRVRTCIYLEQRPYTQNNKKKRWALNILNILMNIFGLYAVLAFFLKLGGVKI